MSLLYLGIGLILCGIYSQRLWRRFKVPATDKISWATNDLLIRRKEKILASLPYLIGGGLLLVTVSVAVMISKDQNRDIVDAVITAYVIVGLLKFGMTAYQFLQLRNIYFIYGLGVYAKYAFLSLVAWPFMMSWRATQVRATAIIADPDWR